MSISDLEAKFASSFYDHVYNHPNHAPSDELLQLYAQDQSRARRLRRMRHLEGMARYAPVLTRDPDFVRGWPPGRKIGVGRALRRLGYSRTHHRLPQDQPALYTCSAPFQQLNQRTYLQGYSLGSNEQEYLFPNMPYDSYGGWDYYLESVRTIAAQGLFSIAGFSNEGSRPNFVTYNTLEGLAPEASMRQGFFMPELPSLDPTAILVTAHLSRDSFGGGVEGCWQPGREDAPGQGLLWPQGYAEVTATLFDGLRVYPGEPIQSQTATGKELLISAFIQGDSNGNQWTADANGSYPYSIDVLQGDIFAEQPDGVDVQAVIKRPLQGAIFLSVEVSLSFYFLKYIDNPLSGIGLENRLPIGQVQLAVPGDPYNYPPQPIRLDSITVCAF